MKVQKTFNFPTERKNIVYQNLWDVNKYSIPGEGQTLSHAQMNE